MQEMLAASGGGGGNTFEFVETVTFTGGGVFNLSDFSKFEVQITSIPLAINSLKLYGGTNGSFTSVKIYTATTSTYEDVLPLLSGYDEFKFATNGDAQYGVLNVKATLA